MKIISLRAPKLTSEEELDALNKKVIITYEVIKSYKEKDIKDVLQDLNDLSISI